MTNLNTLDNSVKHIIAKADIRDLRFIAVLGMDKKGDIFYDINSMPIEIMCMLKEILDVEVKNQLNLTRKTNG